MRLAPPCPERCKMAVSVFPASVNSYVASEQELLFDTLSTHDNTQAASATRTPCCREAYPLFSLFTSFRINFVDVPLLDEDQSQRTPQLTWNSRVEDLYREDSPKLECVVQFQALIRLRPDAVHLVSSWRASVCPMWKEVLLEVQQVVRASVHPVSPQLEKLNSTVRWTSVPQVHQGQLSKNWVEYRAPA
ncbi:hypothetical protein CYLTODRAFT_221693 [Cylindrobasidium torrendii FP15055 ss-10]|uniref:Uncharacterized protein n=1 Tax=Cylindrobasidium torrendii FP15055 ss-10 TaxID=1314674 RepID=A0A0D7BHY8_9AGAR|nr:hypothetical protein CYLTODRAFT_221693 [Cylindrobasidium torrendii FP15055 ss-10]